MARALVIEDEMIIAMTIEDMLHDLGHAVAGTAMALAPALELAQTVDADVAILDINLNGVESFPVAEVLQTRGIPFFFASGYGSGGLGAGFSGHMTIRKPFDMRDLAQAIDSLTN